MLREALNEAQRLVEERDAAAAAKIRLGAELREEIERLNAQQREIQALHEQDACAVTELKAGDGVEHPSRVP